jgi:multidrug efflux pump subunit AcrB
MVFIIMLGAINMIRTQNQGYPAVDFGVVNITTVYPGAAPEDVEVRVTTKIEDELKTVSGIDSMQSGSMENISVISVILEEDADYEEVVDDIQKAVNQVDDFPEEVESPPQVVEVNNDRIPIKEIAIIGSADYETKRKYALNLEKRLQANDEVGKVEKLGYLDREVQIEVNQTALDRKYVSLMSVVNAIQLHNIRLSGGDVASNPEKKVVLMSEFEDPLDVKNVIVRSGFDGNRVVLTDVAKVVDGYEKPEKIYRYNGHDTINVIIYKKENSDILVATDEVESILEEFRETLPDNVRAEVIVDYSVSVESLLTLVKNNAKIGLVFVLIALMLFLNFRVAFWTAVGIPVSIFFAFIFMFYLDVTINFISLMGILIVLGLLVDDAIVIAENIYSYKEKGLNPKDAAYKGTIEVLWPVITTVVTTVVAFAPFLAMTGVMGKFMWQMPIVVTFVLLGSLVESLILLPSHIAHSKVSKKEKKKNWFDKIGDIYEKFTERTMRYRWVTLGAFIAMFIFAIVLLNSGMKFVLFGSDEGDFGYIKFEAEVGTPIEETSEKVKQFEAILKTVPETEVISFVTTVGEKNPVIDEMGGNVTQGSLGNIILHIAPEAVRTDTAKNIMESIKEKVKDVQGFTKFEVARVQDGPPVGRAVTVTLISNDDDSRNKVANKLKDFLAKQDGVFKIEDTEGTGKKTIKVEVNQDLASRLGINSTLIAQTIRAAFDGFVATDIRKGGEEIDFRVKLNDRYRGRIDSIKRLKVSNPDGRLIPLGQLIKIKEIDDVLMINHYDGDRSITVYADVDTEVITSVEINRKIQELLDPLLLEYPDLRVEVGGEEKNTQESMVSLVVALGLALIGIYSVLVILFNSFSQPFIVMAAIPFAFSGVVYTFFIHGINFGFMAIIGLIGLTGIVVNDALVMISMLNRTRDEGGVDLESLAKAAKRRFRPIMLTTITTAAGLFPTAYGWGGDNAFLVPMIMSVAWGLVFATIITLVLVPALYVMHMNAKATIKGVIGKVTERFS